MTPPALSLNGKKWNWNDYLISLSWFVTLMEHILFRFREYFSLMPARLSKNAIVMRVLLDSNVSLPRSVQDNLGDWAGCAWQFSDPPPIFVCRTPSLGSTTSSQWSACRKALSWQRLWNSIKHTEKEAETQIQIIWIDIGKIWQEGLQLDEVQLAPNGFGK